MELVPITTSLLHNLESGQFIQRIISDFQGTGLDAATDPEFKMIYKDLTDQAPIYNLALAQIIAQQESEMLFNLDQKRDKKVISLRYAWNAYRSEDEGSAKKQAYNKLKPLMNNYKNIAIENYEAESLGLDNFIIGLTNAENYPSVQLLNMEEHVNNLKSGNDLFKTTFNSRSNTTVSTVTYNTKLLKKKIFATYKELATYSHTMANRRTPSPYFITVLGAINNGRTYYANIIAHRGNGDTAAPTV